MDKKQQLDNEVNILSIEITGNPNDDELYMERGKLYHRMGVFDKALNDFIKARALNKDNIEAKQYISMIKEIFEYRYTDIYNP